MFSLRPVLLVNLGAKALGVAVWATMDAPALALACFFLPDALVLYHVFVPSAQGLGRVFTRFETQTSEVWLTIDDGPDTVDTPLILDLLDRHKAVATFFLIGERAARHPALVAEIVRRGHEVGHHTHTHPAATFWCASPARLRAELDRATAAFAAAGAQARWFRAPAGIKHVVLERALRRRALQCVAWSVRSGDCFGREPAKVAAGVMRRLRPGSIVLLHEGKSVRPAVRVRAIALVLEACAARRFRCVLPAPSQLR